MICRGFMIGSLVLLWAAAAQAESPDSITATPGALWRVALEHSGELQASGYSADSKQFLYLGSGRLPDPMLRIGFSPRPLETRNGPVDFTATFSQKIPWPGGLSDSRDRMMYAAEAAEIEESITALRLRTEITSLWASMYVTNEEITVLSREMERLEHLWELADVRYRSGQAGLSVLLAIENRSEVVRARLFGAELELESLTLEMYSLAGVEDARLSWPDSVPEEEFFLQGIEKDYVLQDMPAVSRSLALVRSAAAAAEASRAALYPGFEVGATWSVIGQPEVEMGAVDPGRDGFAVFAGFSVPLGYSGSAENSEAAALGSTASEYLHRQLEADQEAVRQRRVNRVRSLLEMHGAYTATVIPNTRAMYQLAVADWISGRTDIENVIEILADLEEAELEKASIYSEAVKNYAKLLEIEGRNTEEGEFL